MSQLWRSLFEVHYRMTPERFLQFFVRSVRDVSGAWWDESGPEPTLHVLLNGGTGSDARALAERFGVHRVDCEYVGKIEILRVHAVHATEWSDYTRCQNEPVKLGTQVQPQRGDWVGTAGCPVWWTDSEGRYHCGVLTNWHVADSGLNKIGSSLHQPDRSRGPIAYLVLSIAVKPEIDNEVDASVCDALVDGYHTIDRRILSLGEFRPTIRAASVGMRAVKVGRTTGITHGVCGAVGVAAKVSYGDFTATFTGLDLYRDTGERFAAAGDSGSLILCEDCVAPSSLLFAGGNGVTLGIPCSKVREKLGVSFGVGG